MPPSKASGESCGRRTRYVWPLGEATERTTRSGSKAETVAARMREYAELGIDSFIFSGYPHLEEAYRVAELLFPLLPLERRQSATRTNLTGPFGEMIANQFVPRQSQS